MLVFYGEDVTCWMEALQAQHTPSNTSSILTSHGGTLYTSNNLHSSGSNSSNNLTTEPHGTHAPDTPCGFSYSSANTSVGLPHVTYDVTVELGVQGKTPQVRVGALLGRVYSV